MAEVAGFEIYVSVLFLVVIGLSRRTREITFETRDIAKRENIGVLPNLGKFTLLHSMNVLFLFIGFYITLRAIIQSLPNVDIVSLTLLAMIFFLTFLLPEIELDNYEFFSQKPRPRCINCHAWLTISSFLIIPILLTLFVHFFGKSPYIRAIWLLLYITSFLLLIYIPLMVMRRDILNGHLLKEEPMNGNNVPRVRR